MFAIIIPFLAMFQVAQAYEIKSVWKEESGKAGKQYLVVLKADEYNAGDSVVIFGKNKTKLSVRSFDLGGMTVYGYEGFDIAGADDFYNLTLTVVEKDQLMTVQLQGSNPKYKHSLVYRKHDSPKSLEFANEAVTVAYKEFARVDAMIDPKDLNEFKKQLALLKRKLGYGATDNWDTKVPFPVYDLQIEIYWKQSPANKSFAKEAIRADGTDAISKALRLGNQWLDEAAVPRPEDMDPELAYSYYREKAKLFEKTNLKKGAEKFIRYEIANAYTFPCEDFFIGYTDWTWVLQDGSTFSYNPSLECD